LKKDTKYDDEESKNLTADFSSDMKKLKGMEEHAEKVFDTNWDTLNQYES
jgi:hypothetical protein